MTVHAVEIVCSKNQKNNPGNVPSPEPPELPNVVPDRVSQNVFNNLTEALPEQRSKASVKQASSQTGYDVDHVQGVYRVEKGAAKKDVADSFEPGVVKDAEWYELRYHDCDHDESDRTGCGDWKTERTKGTIPQGI